MAHGTSTKVTVGAQQRVSELPDQSLTISSGKLYCQTCSTVLSKKKSTVSNHITSCGPAFGIVVTAFVEL